MANDAAVRTHASMVSAKLQASRRGIIDDMNTRRFLRWAAGIIIFIILAAVAFFIGGNSALGKLNIASITADQAAQAMSDDDFYGLYRERTLIVTGVVESVASVNGDTRVTFQTNTLSKTYCDLGTGTTTAKPGDALRVLAEGFTAARLPSGVLLANCVQL